MGNIDRSASGVDGLSLTQLATMYQTSGQFEQKGWGGIQLNNSIYSERSFTNQQDLYYVFQEIDFTNITDADPCSWVGFVNNQLPETKEGKRLSPLTLQPGPQSNPGTTTLTTSVSNTISGSVGWNQSQGFNASIGYSVTYANSQSSQVPPMVISYSGNPEYYGKTEWSYTLSNKTPGVTTTIVYNQWIWAIPFDHYAANMSEIQFISSVDLYYENQGNPGPPLVLKLTSSIPFPMGRTFELMKPRVTGVSPAVVSPGESFTIQGQGLYPQDVQDVFIGGQSVPKDNVNPVIDTEVQVLAPNTPSNGPQDLVVRTSQGFSNNDVRIEIKGPASKAASRTK